MSDNTVSFGTYVTSGTLLQAGEHISNGEKVTITPDIIKRIIQNAKVRGKPSPLYNRHRGVEIGKNMKLVHDDAFTKVELLTLITDLDLYNEEILRGNDKISPDIELYFDESGKVIDGVLLGASLTNNPGMNFESITAQKLEFSAGEQDIPENNTQDVPFTAESIKPLIKELIEERMTGNDWTPPTGDTTTTPVVETQHEQTTDNAPGASSSIDMDNLQSIIQEAIAKGIEEKLSAMKEVEISKQKQQEINEMAQSDNPAVSKEILEDYARAIAERDQYKSEIEKSTEREYQNELDRCKQIGIKNPERYVANVNLSFDQKCTLLKNIRENYAKSAPMVKTPQEPMAAGVTKQPGDKSNEQITVDVVAQKLGANSQDFKTMLSELSIFKDGKFVGR